MGKPGDSFAATQSLGTTSAEYYTRHTVGSSTAPLVSLSLLTVLLTAVAYFALA